MLGMKRPDGIWGGNITDLRRLKCPMAERRLTHLTRTDLHAEGEDGDDDLEDEGEGELPQGVVDAGPRRAVWDVVHRPAHVGVVDVIAELRRLERAAVVEELGDELAGAAARVRVGVRQQGRDARHGDDLHDRVLPQLGGLPPPAPGDVGPDEEGPPEAAEDPQQDEGHQLGHVPRRVVLHVEQDQAAVAKRVDGAQREGGDQRGEEGTPQRLQGEVIADLQQGNNFQQESTTSGLPSGGWLQFRRVTSTKPRPLDVSRWDISPKVAAKKDSFSQFR